jgi:cystathionine beta-synthase
MKVYDVSQLPVLNDGKVVGIIDEFDLLSATFSDPRSFQNPVADHMSTDLITLPPTAALEEALALLQQGLVPLIVEGTRFFGIITRMDVLHYLRKLK